MKNWKHWLEDRGTHRAPIDAHFEEALQWIDTHQDGATVKVLELGPGPQDDLALWLRQHGFYVVAADLAGQDGPDSVDLRPHWNDRTKHLPFEWCYFNAVLAREVMEHVDDIYRMVDEIHRVLLPGGRFWFSSLFVFPLHDYPGDYWRLTPSGWEWLLQQAGFRRHNIKAERLLFDSWQYPVSVLGWGEK